MRKIELSEDDFCLLMWALGVTSGKAESDRLRDRLIQLANTLANAKTTSQPTDLSVRSQCEPGPPGLRRNS